MKNKNVFVSNNPLKILFNKKGNLRHIIRSDFDGFNNFEEAYLTDINHLDIKGWKLHKNKTSNLVVVYGHVKFVLWEPSKPNIFLSHHLGIIEGQSHLYSRLTIPPHTWFAFQGLQKPLSRILNISNVLHEHTISEELDLDCVHYPWIQ